MVYVRVYAQRRVWYRQYAISAMDQRWISDGYLHLYAGWGTYVGDGSSARGNRMNSSPLAQLPRP